MKIDIIKYKREEVHGMIGLLCRQLKEIEKAYDDLVTAYYSDDAVFLDTTNQQVLLKSKEMQVLLKSKEMIKEI